MLPPKRALAALARRARSDRRARGLLQVPSEPTVPRLSSQLLWQRHCRARAAMVDRSALAHAIAGASASALAVALFYPLDQLRVHEQLSTEPQEERKGFHILRALRLRLEAVGIAGLYQGLPSSLVAIVWANFFYFFAYDRTGEAPQLGAGVGTRASSGRAWQLWAARHSQPTGIAATASEARACPCLRAR